MVRRWWCGAGGEELVARLVVRLALARFFDQVCDQLCIAFPISVVDFAPKTGQKSTKHLKNIFFGKSLKKD